LPGRVGRGSVCVAAAVFVRDPATGVLEEREVID
jgi:hypothetical protein